MTKQDIIKAMETDIRLALETQAKKLQDIFNKKNR